MKEIFLNNTNHLKKITQRFTAYSKFAVHSLSKGIAPSEIIATQFPFLFNDFHYPPILTVELTNICNLSCAYCDSPLKLRTKGYMSDEVALNLIKQLKEKNAHRVRLVGTGEATLHKNFQHISNNIIANSKYVTLVTNGHWHRNDMVEIISSLNFGMVEFSIDAGDDVDFMNSRKGQLQKVISNLKELKIRRDKLKSKTLINVRLMVRPSMKAQEQYYLNKYKQIADIAFVQYVTVSRNFEYKDDVFLYKQKLENSVPRCTLPSKDLEIRYNGDVLLCGPSSRQIGEPGLIAGNILTSEIEKIWNGEIFKNYRRWHKNKNTDELALCKGCNGF